MPSSTAFCTAGPMAEESCASTISTLAFCEIRPSMSVNCFCADDCASAEIYLSPAAAIAAFIAASSVFHRSSWKFDQETPTTLPLASAAAISENDSAAPANRAVASFLMMILPVPGHSGCACRCGQCRSFFRPSAGNFAHVGQQSVLLKVAQGRILRQVKRL